MTCLVWTTTTCGGGNPPAISPMGKQLPSLAGDGLLTYAFETASRPILELPQRQLRAVQELSKAAGTYGMIGGQVVDIEHEDTSIDRETLALLHKMKTGALIRAAARLSCIAAGHPQSRRKLPIGTLRTWASPFKSPMTFWMLWG